MKKHNDSKSTSSKASSSLSSSAQSYQSDWNSAMAQQQAIDAWMLSQPSRLTAKDKARISSAQAKSSSSSSSSQKGIDVSNEIRKLDNATLMNAQKSSSRSKQQKKGKK